MHPLSVSLLHLRSRQTPAPRCQARGRHTASCDANPLGCSPSTESPGVQHVQPGPTSSSTCPPPLPPFPGCCRGGRAPSLLLRRCQEDQRSQKGCPGPSMRHASKLTRLQPLHPPLPPLPGAETARDSCFQGSPAAPRLGVEIQSSLMVASAGAGAARPTAGRFTPRCRTVTQPRWRVGKADPGFPQSHIPKCRPQEPGLLLPQGASLQDPSGKKKGQTITGLARRKGLRNPCMLPVGM